MSDGAGSSPVAKEASSVAVNVGANYYQTHGRDFFDSAKRKQVEKELIFDIQQALFEKAKYLNATLSDMMCTLLILGIDKINKKYITIHIGDGLIAKKNGDNIVNILSYPENGITKQYTYFVNSPNVFEHLRTTSGDCYEDDSFFIGTDGCFEGCLTSKEYAKQTENIKDFTVFRDDATYCIISNAVL